MRQHIWAGLINGFIIASRQLFHLALAQLCVGFKHSGNANPSLFADSVSLYAINLIKAFCIEFRRLLHTKAARNPVPGRLMSCCSLSF
ncbi:hypothetical protein BO79DRAFT_267083 [Aspergillus costaricaensis CBS 115574]|uniref:Uncharacterized protein n=1 Tax=Aspergillus costaricaensis CBS 115574 TaxID=1448317 RepID=A0ACD1ICU4_9EURO|nr:hypothetical protein BO79DRAFT_267083 [Aspergillus costaricaensis CBS 115574]RAK88185.1 hypothetical protein BO79DRAFT_267083 [Aspergillus costaricaensis CBS 115574]